MSTTVTLPQLGESVTEGTVGAWLVREGERVEVDQPIVEVTTDKADTEIPAPAAGVIGKILVAEGETVEVGAELAVIEEAAAGAGRGAQAGAERGARPAPEREPSPRARAPSQQGEAAAAPPPPPPSGARPTPVARRAAEQTGVDLSGMEGTGVGGRVTRLDVERRAAGRRRAGEREVAREGERAAPAGRAPARPAFLDYELQPGDRVIPMSPLRKIIAQHMVLSKRVSPHVGTVAEIDMGGVARFRDQHKRAFRESHGFSLTFLPFVVQATVRALREFPALNASVVEETIVEKRDIHVGIAVETEKGLVVPVVRHADRLSLAGLAETVEDLSRRARSKRLSADELKGGTFTISNPGRQGNLYGFAIINQPQVGILRMGEMVKRPVVRAIDGEDAIVVRPIMMLALSYDHRAVDGAPANGFLYRVRELLEEAEFTL